MSIDYIIKIYCEATKEKQNGYDLSDAPPAYKAMQATLLPHFLQQNNVPTPFLEGEAK